jgi:hypothetical protein
MTLILTYISQKRIIQVSDRRISYGENSLIEPDDTVRKNLMLGFGNEQLSAAYTGSPAQLMLDRKPLLAEDWLFRTISALPAYVSPGDLLCQLTEKIDCSFRDSARHFKIPRRDCKLTVTMVGFDSDNKNPVLVCISNFEKLGMRLLPSPENKFVPINVKTDPQFTSGDFTTYIHSSPFSKKPIIIAHGNWKILNSDDIKFLSKRLQDIEKRNLSHRAIREVLVSVIRKSVLRQVDSNVSKQYLSISFDANNPSAIEAGQHSIDSDEWIMPRLATPGIGTEIWLYSKDLNKRKHEEFDLNAEIKVDTFRTYMETNDEAKFWTEFGKIKKRLIFWGNSEQIVSLAKEFRISTIGDLHNLLLKCRGWGEKFLDSHYEYLLQKGCNALSVSAPILLLIIASKAENISRGKIINDFYLDEIILQQAIEAKCEDK